MKFSSISTGSSFRGAGSITASLFFQKCWRNRWRGLVNSPLGASISCKRLNLSRNQTKLPNDKLAVLPECRGRFDEPPAKAHVLKQTAAIKKNNPHTKQIACFSFKPMFQQFLLDLFGFDYLENLLEIFFQNLSGLRFFLSCCCLACLFF